MFYKKLYKIYLSIGLIGLMVVAQSCSDILDEPVRSQLSSSFLATDSGINSLLVSAYSHLDAYNTNNAIGMDEWCTDIAWETGGGLNGRAKLVVNFTWDPSSITTGQFVFWQPYYRSIRDANMVLDNIENADIDSQNKKEYQAEARFIRALAYYRLWRWFGPVPIRKSSEEPLEIARPGEDEFISFVSSEFKAVISDLPEYGNEKQYGRAHKSAARAFLTKLFLNTKQWKKTADMAKEIIDGGKFELYPSYPDLFKVENERNNEFIWVWQMVASTSAKGNPWLMGAFPPGFDKAPDLGVSFNNSWQNWAAQFRMRDQFVNSFNEDDQRKNLFLREYINDQGETVSLTGNDNIRSFKYWPDPNGIGTSMGNDIPVVRYADILLSRAEALNELNGPNQESIDLVNLIRERAGLDDVQMGDFGSKEALRDHILEERGWEFYSEGKRRMDLIRMGKFISNAQKRGISNAKDYMTRYPIPQSAMDANPKLEQNEGY